MLPEGEIWLDAHLSPILAKWIHEETGLKVLSAFALGVHRVDDAEIFKLTVAAGKVIIISKDADFSGIVKERGAPPKLIKLNTGNLKSRHLWAILKPCIHEAIRSLVDRKIDVILIDQNSNIS